MECRWRTPAGDRSTALVAGALLAVLVVGWLASPASAQVPDLPVPPELPLPDPPEVPLPDPGDLPVPNPHDLPAPDPGDLPVPDPGDLPVPDPGDLPVPDPGDLPVPDPDPGDTPDHGSGKGKDRPASETRSGPRGGDQARVRGTGGLTTETIAALAAVRGGTPIGSANPAESGPEDNHDGVLKGVAPYAFPVFLMVAVAAFLALQGYFDRRDPKLALGPVDPTEQLLSFD